MEPVIYSYKFYEKLLDPSALFTRYDNTLKNCGFTILGFTEHFFRPHGWTGLWLLGESHFAIHTFPEAGSAYCELSSCNKTMYDKFYHTMSAYDVTEDDIRVHQLPIYINGSK